MNALNDLWEGTTKIVNSLPGLGSVFPPRETAERVVIKEVDMYRGSRGGGLLLRLAGLSGATAVMMAAYGAHVFKDKQVPESQTLAFANGNKMHLIHSVALLGVPLTRRPILVGTLLSFGILLFSGSCYCHALTGNTKVRMITPYGGMALILGWLAMLL